MSEIGNIAALSEWYKKPIGTALLQSELVGLSNILPQIFGYYIIQIGGPIDSNEILATSHIHNHIIINSQASHHSNNSLAVQCELYELPFLPESIDVAVLFHVLEFSKKPRSILKEIYTALIPNGYAIIFGFNPYSLWHIASFWEKQKQTPWLGNWISSWRMRHLLVDTSFSIGDYKTFYFRPPSNNTEKLLFLENIGKIFWPYCGASYMFVVQKKIAALTSVGPILSFMKYFKTAKALPKPATRDNQKCNKNQTI